MSANVSRSSPNWGVQHRVVDAQRGVRQPEVGVAGFDQRVVVDGDVLVRIAGVIELVEEVDAGAAGHAVRPGAADDHVVHRRQVRSDDDIVVGAAVQV